MPPARPPTRRHWNSGFQSVTNVSGKFLAILSFREIDNPGWNYKCYCASRSDGSIIICRIDIMSYCQFQCLANDHNLAKVWKNISHRCSIFFCFAEVLCFLIQQLQLVIVAYPFNFENPKLTHLYSVDGMRRWRKYMECIICTISMVIPPPCHVVGMESIVIMWG